MLSVRDAFKVGFLARCAASGMSMPEIRSTVKAACDKLALLGQAVDLAKDVGGALLSAGIPLALAVPPVVGGLGGYGLARLTDMDDTDVKSIKDKEVLDTYRRNIDQLKRQKAVRDYQRARKLSGRIL